MNDRACLSLMLTVTAAAACAPQPRLMTAGDVPAALDLSAVPLPAETYEDEDLDHLRWVLDEGQIASYPSLTADARREMLRVVWASLDPTPTTERNERKEAHYRRLAYARTNFLRKGAPPWDKRGELLLRYGSPSIREVLPAIIEYGQVIPPREIWTYVWPAMAFEMADLLLKDDFQDSYLWHASARPDLAHGSGGIEQASSALGGIAPPALQAEVARQKRDLLFGEGVRAQRKSGPAGQKYLHDYGGRTLGYVFDVVHFAAADGRGTAVHVDLLFDVADFTFERDAAEVEVDVVAKTKDYREVARASHVLRQSRRAGTNGLVADVVTMDLPPGDYRLALQARDVHSGDVGVFTTETAVRSFARGALDLSDVQLASSIEEGKPGTRFSRGEILVVPNPAAVFRRGHPATLYFEIYGLWVPQGAEARYTIQVAISPRIEGAAKERPTVAISQDGAARRTRVPKYFSLDTREMKPGLYDVEVQVTDRNAGTTVRRGTTLQVRASSGRRH